MATRNRTAEFKKQRDAVKSLRSSSASGSTGPAIEMVSPSLLGSSNTNHSSYVHLSTADDDFAIPSDSSIDAYELEEISANVKLARTKMAELTKALSKALMPSFGDGKEDQPTIETLTGEITDLLRKSENELKKLSAAESSEDSDIKRNVEHFLATELQKLLKDLWEKQSTYLKCLLQQKEGHDEIDLEMNLNGNVSRSEDDTFSNLGFHEHQTIKPKKSEQFPEESEIRIKQVLESLDDLAQIMRDPSVLAIDQGTIDDRIDYHIRPVAASGEEGLKQLKKKQNMGDLTFTQEATSPVPPSEMFKALILDQHNLLPKLVPQDLKSMDIIEGDGGVGTIEQINFAGGPYKYMKHRIEALDVENCYSRYTLFEGDVLDKLESITFDAKFEPSGEGCVYKFTSPYYPKPGVELKVEEFKEGQEKAMGVYKLVEGYVIANLGAYA